MARWKSGAREAPNGCRAEGSNGFCADGKRGNASASRTRSKRQGRSMDRRNDCRYEIRIPSRPARYTAGKVGNVDDSAARKSRACRRCVLDDMVRGGRRPHVRRAKKGSMRWLIEGTKARTRRSDSKRDLAGFARRQRKGTAWSPNSEGDIAKGLQRRGLKECTRLPFLGACDEGAVSATVHIKPDYVNSGTGTKDCEPGAVGSVLSGRAAGSTK